MFHLIALLICSPPHAFTFKAVNRCSVFLLRCSNSYSSTLGAGKFLTDR